MNERMGRREAMRKFLNIFCIGLGALAGAVVSVPIVAYLLSPLIKPSANVWRTVGTLDSFIIGKTVQVSVEDPSPLKWSGQTAQTAAWLRRNNETDFTVFAINCTHLGCPVNWVDGAQLFFCPCHGGVYYADGAVAAGPPPRALFRYQWRILNGDVQVKTRKLPIG
jgi:menaquinol-cytochrome c reductase iron-sulfur subunit